MHQAASLRSRFRGKNSQATGTERRSSRVRFRGEYRIGFEQVLLASDGERDDRQNAGASGIEIMVSTNFLCPARQFDPAITEMMDRSQPVSKELETDLGNLEKLNRHFGRYSLIRFF